VHDQDEALAFYTEKLGWEVRADVTLPEMGNFRWLTVGPAGQPDVEFVEPPEGRPYGVDSAFRDPSGNFVRLTQLRELPAD
jgi:catechol 2,3-dioxygenase-like lactoylglutathione lyase family enzyme